METPTDAVAWLRRWHEDFSTRLKRFGYTPESIFLADRGEQLLVINAIQRDKEEEIAVAWRKANL
jgi:hypothetical protein